MCGIAGFCGFIGKVAGEAGVAATLRRRGPDADGVYAARHVWLAHTRLAVVDLANGGQPMIFAPGPGEKALVYNGELYNTEELRAQLAERGFKFRGHSDTEVLLAAYAHWGPAAVEKLNGIFAFAVWDRRQEQLFVARDRLGVKPFFYCQTGGGFLFGSEIKALLAFPGMEAVADGNALAELFLLGPGRTPGCGVFKNIRELLPGHWGLFDRQGFKTRPYWSLTARRHTQGFEETVETVRYLVGDAIRRQTVSDVPLASFLSGGLDSSAIAALSGVSRTFSVHYADNERYFTPGKFQPDSDDRYIDLMAQRLGVCHTRVTLEVEDLVEALFRAVDARDLPGMADVDSSLLLFCKKVRESVTVALSGECADEIFGGYPWYRDAAWSPAEGFPWSKSTEYRAKFAREGVLPKDPLAYIQNRCRRTGDSAPALPEDTAQARRMRQLFRLNLDWFMQTLLDRKDRMSMYSGLEVRVPFCDHRIVEYLYNAPWAFKEAQGREKGLLRQALAKDLPEEILTRKKSPYPKTHHPEYRQAVARLLGDILADPNAPLHALANKDELARLLTAEDAAPWYGQLMTAPQTMAYFVQMNYWLKKYRVRVAV